MPLYASMYGQEDPTFYSQVLGQPRSKRPGLYEGLFMSGAGLMGGRDWSEGMTQGMKGFGQGIEMGQHQASRDMTNQIQMGQLENSIRKQQMDREAAAKKQQAETNLSQFMQSGGDVNSPEGKALLFNAGMGEQAVQLSKPQNPVNPNLVAVVGEDGKPVYKPAAEAAGMMPYKEPPSRNTQIVQTAEGVYTLTPEGGLGNRLGSPVRAVSDGPAKPPSGYRWNADGTGLEAIPNGPADKSKNEVRAPSGYRWKDDGSLEPIPNGPADKPAGTPAQANEAAKKSLQLDNLGTAMDSYEKELSGLSRMDLATLAAGTPNAKAAALSSLHTNLMINMKNLFELGALSGPDYQLMQDSVGSLTSPGTLANPENLKTRLKVVKENLANARKNLNQNYGGKPQAAQPEAVSARKKASNGKSYYQGADGNWYEE